MNIVRRKAFSFVRKGLRIFLSSQIDKAGCGASVTIAWEPVSESQIDKNTDTLDNLQHFSGKDTGGALDWVRGVCWPGDGPLREAGWREPV